MRLPASIPASSLSIFLQWLILLPMSRAMLNGFTTVVEAGKANCFYENISDNKTLEIEYQVRQNCTFSDFIEMHASKLTYSYFPLGFIYFRSAVQTNNVCGDYRLRQ